MMRFSLAKYCTKKKTHKTCPYNLSAISRHHFVPFLSIMSFTIYLIKLMYFEKLYLFVWRSCKKLLLENMYDIVHTLFKAIHLLTTLISPKNKFWFFIYFLWKYDVFASLPDVCVHETSISTVRFGQYFMSTKEPTWKK